MVDGLDECSNVNNKPATFIARIQQIIDRYYDQTNKVCLLVTSRLKNSAFHDAKVVEVCPNTADIAGMVRRRVEDPTFFLDRSMSEQVRRSNGLQGEIVDTVVQKAHGMFLTAPLSLDSLESKMNVRSLKKALEDMPDRSEALD